MNKSGVKMNDNELYDDEWEVTKLDVICLAVSMMIGYTESEKNSVVKSIIESFDKYS